MKAHRLFQSLDSPWNNMPSIEPFQIVFLQLKKK
jgi:hypothetical protein